jgi:hypothetical protein
MIVRVSGHRDAPEIALDNPDDCLRFSVVVDPAIDEESLASWLDASGFGAASDQPGHVLVSVKAVRDLAAGQVGAGWGAKFADMLAYADTKGWMQRDGSMIAAHVDAPA